MPATHTRNNEGALTSLIRSGDQELQKLSFSFYSTAKNGNPAHFDCLRSEFDCLASSFHLTLNLSSSVGSQENNQLQKPIFSSSRPRPLHRQNSSYLQLLKHSMSKKTRHAGVRERRSIFPPFPGFLCRNPTTDPFVKRGA